MIKQFLLSMFAATAFSTKLTNLNGFKKLSQTGTGLPRASP